MLLHKAEHGEAPIYSGLHRILHNYFAIGPCHMILLVSVLLIVFNVVFFVA